MFAVLPFWLYKIVYKAAGYEQSFLARSPNRFPRLHKFLDVPSCWNSRAFQTASAAEYLGHIKHPALRPGVKLLWAALSIPISVSMVVLAVPHVARIIPAHDV